MDLYGFSGIISGRHGARSWAADEWSILRCWAVIEFALGGWAEVDEDMDLKDPQGIELTAKARATS